MATKIPFPYPCNQEYLPSFDTQHEAATLIADYQARGHIKKCAHVHVDHFRDEFSDLPTYGPGCYKDSFDVRRGERGGNAFHGCPKDCRLYEPAWRGSTKEWVKERWWPLRRSIVGTAQWYASLSPYVQVILALALLALVGAPWRDTILEGLKIVFAK